MGRASVHVRADSIALCRFVGATAEAVKKAFELLLAEKAVKSIFVNIFGGMYVPSTFLVRARRLTLSPASPQHALRCHRRVSRRPPIPLNSPSSR